MAAADCWAARENEGEGDEGGEDEGGEDEGGEDWGAAAAMAVLTGLCTADTVARDCWDLLSISLLLAGSTRRLK
jgi:hypothetical protein